MYQITVLAILLLFSSPGEAQVVSQNSVRLLLGMQNKTSQNQNHQANLFGLKGRVFAHSQATDWLAFNTGMEVLMQTGDVQYTYYEEIRPKNEITLLHATATVDWRDQLFLDAGALNPNSDLSWPVFRPLSFPGARSSWRFRSKYFDNKLTAAQTFAAQPLSSRQGQGEKLTPVFEYQALDLIAKPTSYFRSSLQISHWVFRNLTNLTAHQSRFLGNDISGEGRELAYFPHKFEGLGLTWTNDLLKVFGDNRIFIRGHLLQNQKAPKGTDTGYEASLGSQFGLSHNLNCQIESGQFAKGANLFPAYYLNEARGVANQRGLFGQISLSYLPQNLATQVYYAQGRNINKNPYQSNFDYLLISLVQSHEFF